MKIKYFNMLFYFVMVGVFFGAIKSYRDNELRRFNFPYAPLDCVGLLEQWVSLFFGILTAFFMIHLFLKFVDDTLLQYGYGRKCETDGRRKRR